MQTKSKAPSPLCRRRSCQRYVTNGRHGAAKSIDSCDYALTLRCQSPSLQYLLGLFGELDMEHMSNSASPSLHLVFVIVLQLVVSIVFLNALVGVTFSDALPVPPSLPVN